MSWFNSLKSFTSSLVDSALKVVSLDALEEEIGQSDNRKELYSGLDFTYLTPRIIAMGFPSSPDTRIRSRNDAGSVAALLAERHSGHYMIWNLSEETYDSAAFENSVIEVKFPGLPAPPLQQIFKLVIAMEAWLNADASNVAVIHCMTGKGRTSVVSACLLCWLGEIDNGLAALDYVCERRYLTVWKRIDDAHASSNFLVQKAKSSGDHIGGVGATTTTVITSSSSSSPSSSAASSSRASTAAAGEAPSNSNSGAPDIQCSPSQIRYVQYFSYVMGGLVPRPMALLLKRILLNGVPDVTPPLLVEDGEDAADAVRAIEIAAALTVADRKGGGGEGGEVTPSRLMNAVLKSADAAATSISAEIRSALSIAGGATHSEEAPSEAEAVALVVTGEAAESSSASHPAVDPVQSFAASTLSTAAVVDNGAVAPSLEFVDGCPYMVSATGTSTDGTLLYSAKRLFGARLFIEIFRGNRLVYSSMWKRTADSSIPKPHQQGAEDSEGFLVPSWCGKEDGSVRFADIDVPVSGDLLLRCRHLGQDGTQETLWRCAFNTGYIDDGGILRVGKNHLDVAVHDDRAPLDSFVEVCFAPIDASPVTGETTSTSAGSSSSIEPSIWDDIHAKISGKAEKSKVAHHASMNNPVSGQGLTIEEIIASSPATSAASARAKAEEKQPPRSMPASSSSASNSSSSSSGVLTAAGKSSITQNAEKTSSTPALDKKWSELEALEEELGLSSVPSVAAKSNSSSASTQSLTGATQKVAAKADADLDAYFSKL